MIADAILDGRPKMIARLGFSEARLLLNYLEIQACKESAGNPLKRFLCLGRDFRHDWHSPICLDICNSSGFFPNDTGKIAKFCEFYIRCMEDCDLVGYFQVIPGEAFLWNRTKPSATFIPVSSLEPYFFNNPWSAALEGKRVLVVHPFAESISSQYRNNRHNLFENRSVLPEFDLVTIPAVQAIRQERTEFVDWFQALAHMQEMISQTDFDVCIIGAGAFGLPLASYVKSLGKISIQMAGTTQILFGIRGTRWERYIPDVAKLFNGFWIRPLPSEHPEDYANNEGGAYW